MEDNELEERLEKLEAGLKALQTPPEPPSRLARLSKFLIANWVLLSFVAAMLTAVYVKFNFGVDYFRDYRSIQAKNTLTAFYTHMGDVLMGRAEWRAAEDAYRNALQIDPGNTTATLGVVKAQIFKPEDGSQFYAAEVVDAKLAYLLAMYPHDAQLMFLKANRLEDEQDTAQAIEWHKKAIETDPNTFGSYFALGYIQMTFPNFNMDEAEKNMNRALTLDPDFPELNENLGYAYLLTQDFTQAQKYLQRGYQLAPAWDKACSIADTFRIQGKLDETLRYRRWALKELETAKPTERSVEATSAWNYMPLRKDDRKTIENTIFVRSPQEKRAFTHYNFSLDYAMLQNFKLAESERTFALSLDTDHEYLDYFADIGESLKRLAPMNQATAQWLQENDAKLIKLETDN
jgi:tetratricopeptide (TPR) repeat protein